MPEQHLQTMIITCKTRVRKPGNCYKKNSPEKKISTQRTAAECQHPRNDDIGQTQVHVNIVHTHISPSSVPNWSLQPSTGGPPVTEEIANVTLWFQDTTEVQFAGMGTSNQVQFSGEMCKHSGILFLLLKQTNTCSVCCNWPLELNIAELGITSCPAAVQCM